MAMRLISLSPASIHKRTTLIPSSARQRAGMDRVQLISSDDETLFFTPSFDLSLPYCLMLVIHSATDSFVFILTPLKH